jgi:hypothetical protein
LLFRYASRNLANGLVLISTFPRLGGMMAGQDNDGSRLHRLRALADVLLVFESNLALDQGPGLDTMSNRIDRMLATGCTRCARARNDAQDRASNAGLRTGVATDVNSIVRGEILQLHRATTPAEKIGIACFITLTLRNSVMHVVEDQLDVFKSKTSLLECFGIALACVRLGRAGQERDWGSLGV